MKAILEGLLFISGDDGVSLEKVKEILEINEDQLASLVDDLTKEYDNPDRGIRLETLGSKLKLVTKKEYKDYFQKLVDTESDNLSQAALEALAVIAYNQPIVRSQVDEIRGVDSVYVIKKLLVKNLIEEKGRSELPGRPILYGTTDNFLDHFGLHSLEELPIIEQIETEDEEVNLFTTNKNN